MLKFLFGVLTDPLGLPIDPVWEYVILAVIGIVAFCIGWLISPGGEWGTLIHWTVRIIVFFALWAIVRGIIAAVSWIVAHWVLLVCIVGAVILIACVIWILVYVNDMREEKKQNRYEKNER